MLLPKIFSGNRFEKHFLIVVLVILAVTVFIITWFSIKESRSDSYQLLVKQGVAFTEALTQAAQNAIESEHFFDFLVHKRYHEIAIELALEDLKDINDQQLYQMSLNHNLYGIYIYNMDSTLIAGTIVRGPITKIPDYVYKEVCQLISQPKDNYLLLLDEGNKPDEKIHYYIELSNKMDRVILIIADALYYTDALKQTQIGYLAQKMAKENGVEYIIYQSIKGIIFSSRKPGNLLAIESDPFLSQALESDTVMYRKYLFQDREVLELVQPFSTTDYPFGLLRVGLSLNSYHIISKGYDFQMIAVSIILFGLVLVILLYFNSRQKKIELSRQYQQIKSISDKIFEEMSIGVVAVKFDGKIILANNAFEKIFGLKDVIGNNWDKIIKWPELNFSSISTKIEDSFELELTININNNEKYLLVAISKIKQPQNMVVVVSDITRLRELEKKSMRKERLSEMGNLAAGVAHEIRNPLNTIAIASQRLASEFVPYENKEEYLSFTKQIKNETKRLNDIITRFLSLTREDSKKHQIINLSNLINEFIQLKQYEANSLNIEFNIDVDAELFIEGDINNLRQLFENLYNNAKEAFGNKPGRIKIVGKKLGNSIHLQFADNGPGIPFEKRDRVFMPYYTTKEIGTGLGLATVYQIITDLGGDIKIADSQWGGALFIINFPQVKKP